MKELKRLDEVISNTVKAVEQGREQIYDIADNARLERDELQRRTAELKQQVLTVIAEVDLMEAQERAARLSLMEVSRNFYRYKEKDVRLAYEEAQQIQVRLSLLREREKQLRQQRDEMELMLRRITATVEKAEKLVAQVGMALTMLSGNLQGVAVRLEEMHQRQQLSLRIIKAQEEERLRVAREIHDGPAQSMANVVLCAEICEKLLDVAPEQVKGELRNLKETVKESLQEVRKIIFDLRPMVLDDLGLVPTLRRFVAEQQKRTTTVLELVVLNSSERRFPEALEVTVFRVVQEALNNICRHARAQHALVRLELLPRKVNLSVSDDGCGFDAETVLHADGKESYGLLGMRERVELLQGKLKVSSVPGKGSEINVYLPVQE
jgi:two-component system sensor histidine kinase DegS